jgi:hypothetical protein
VKYKVEAITSEGNRAWSVETNEFSVASDISTQAAREHPDWAIMLHAEYYQVVMFGGKIYENII